MVGEHEFCSLAESYQGLTVLIASLLDLQHKSSSVEKKPVSLLMPSGKAFTWLPPAVKFKKFSCSFLTNSNRPVVCRHLIMMRKGFRKLIFNRFMKLLKSRELVCTNRLNPITEILLSLCDTQVVE